MQMNLRMLAAMAHTKTLLIVYHTHTGGTRQMVHALRNGALSESDEGRLEVQMLHASEAGAEDLLQADGYVFATPENLAAMSGMLKDFFDRNYYPAMDHLNGRPYAALICAGSDGSNAARQIARIATGWRLKAVAEPLIICTHAQTPQAIAAPKHLSAKDLAPCHALGAALASGLLLGIF